MDKDQLHFLLKKYNLSPNKIRGQNFLVSDSILEQIVAAAKIKEDDLILEVGPGLGALTQELVKYGDRVVAFEIDKNFAKVLNKIKGVSNNLEIIWQDILSLSDDDWAKILFKHKKEKYKIVANIPYYLTSKFIQKFILAQKKPENMVLMIQKEVAERIVAKDNKNSLLSLSVAFYAKSKIETIVTKDNFYPVPKVDSAVINIFDIQKWPYKQEEKKTWQLIKRGFASKRKKLLNNLSTDPNLSKENIMDVFSKFGLDENIRAENLSPKDWLNLSQNL